MSESSMSPPTPASSCDETLTLAVPLSWYFSTTLTPLSGVLPEELPCPKLLKKFHVFYGTRRFTTVFTRACHLSSARLIHSMLHPSNLPKTNLRLRFSGGLFPSGFLTKSPVRPPSLIHTCHMSCQSQSS